MSKFKESHILFAVVRRMVKVNGAFYLTKDVIKYVPSTTVVSMWWDLLDASCSKPFATFILPSVFFLEVQFVAKFAWFLTYENSRIREREILAQRRK